MAGIKGRDRNILETFIWTLHMWQVIICIRLHSKRGMFIESSLQCCKIIWNKDELEMVQPSSVYRETFGQKVCIEKEFYVIKHALGHFPQIFGTCILLDFMYAYSIVGSRAWGTSKGLSLVMYMENLVRDVPMEGGVNRRGA
ncbi:hypothetical protein ZOSMA_10G00020 [Zostera marina]|uniref:Uncharacterized protein n=1 Tax=Zostera marina TaxID=29655 RepID=A0A0K9Q382_ZOSMR|nr:hypothetical protein ZOSMA_10G00020 [Zostera marina]